MYSHREHSAAAKAVANAPKSEDQENENVSLSLSRKATLVAFPFLFLLPGCNQEVSYTGSVSVTSTGTVTVGGSITIHPKPIQQVSKLDVADFQGAMSSGYSVILNMPSDSYSLDTASPPQVTLSGTTDQGYTSAVTVNLQPVPSTTQPVASGYTPYTFAISNIPEVQAWQQQVSQHTTSTLTFNSNVNTAFTYTGSGGTSTIYAQVNSTQTGLVDSGSTSFSAPAPLPCTGGRCPVQN